MAEILGRDVVDLWPDVLKRYEPQWLREWVDWEHEAVALRWFEHSWIPGLLQTEAYARATQEQLAHLAKMAELPHVQVLVVGEDAGLYPGLQGGFILGTLSDGSVVAHLDHQVRAQVVNQAEDVVTVQRTWEAIRGEAFSRKQSLNLIKEAAKTWT